MSEKKPVGRFFYVLDRKISRDLVGNWQEIRKPFNAASEDFLNHYGAKGPIRNNRGNYCGFYFEENEQAKIQNLPQGLVGDRRNVPGAGNILAVMPDTHFQAGKECHRKMASINKLLSEAPEFGPFVIRVFSLGELSAITLDDDSNPLAVPVFAMVGADERVYISIPYGGESDVPSDHTAWLTPQFKRIDAEKFHSACYVTG